MAHAAAIWNGPTLTYNQPSPDPTQAANQDRITPDVWLTRAASKGLFNAFDETNATALSPANTEWALGALTNYAALHYTNWLALLNGASPVTLVGQPMVVDLRPGDSANSPLIYYVAYLVADNEMPPIGKGDPLTAAQVALLRAWIDQGVVWEQTPLTNRQEVSLAPVLGGTTVSGDHHEFREHYWQKEGVNGGVEAFEWFQQTSPATQWLFTGHALLDDYKLGLAVDRNDLGYIHSGWEQQRKYFDDTGGYYPGLAQPAPRLGEDLHLDLGKAWVDFGLALPGWPRLVLGYEK